MPSITLAPGRQRRKRLSPPVIRYVEQPCSVPGLEGPCHIFQGGTFNGYGRVWDGKRNALVHKYIWEKRYGPVSPNRVLDHKCRRRSCCNVQHLREVTRKVNSTENIVGHPSQLGKAMTHCKRGHEFSADNTRKDRRGCRLCRTCERLRQQPDFV